MNDGKKIHLDIVVNAPETAALTETKNGFKPPFFRFCKN